MEEFGQAKVADNLKPELIETQVIAVVEPNRITNELRIVSADLRLVLASDAIVRSADQLLHSVVQRRCYKQVSLRRKQHWYSGNESVMLNQVCDGTSI